ncbi:MAG: hypothetical protein ABSC35_06505 [Candidatus Dormibacteria bacterium]|jgi:hypothetical protein
MPRPNPPRKRPRRRPDAVERGARAEVTLAKQEAQVKEKTGSADGKRQSSAKAKPTGKTVAKGAAGARGRRIDEPYVPWAKRSYAVLVGVLFVAEVLIGGVYYLTISGSKPAPPPFGIFLLAVSYQPLLPVAAALLAAPIAKFITKEPRSLRFMESIIVGIVQYFVWLSLFVALTYVIGGFNSAATAASSSATPEAIVGLIVIDILSYVAAFYGYPPLYKFMRRRPPPRTAQQRKSKPEPAATQPQTSIVDKMDEASARDSGAKGQGA